MTKAVLVRDDGSLGPRALEIVEQMAGGGRTQATIAATLGLSRKKFETMLSRAKGENPERYAWERGHAKIEQRVADAMFAAGTGDLVEEIVLDKDTKQPVIDEETGLEKTQMVRHVSKIGGAQLMFYAKTQLGWQEKSTGPLVQENRINITLPASMSIEEYYKMLGIDAPLDFRKDKSIPMKDVTKALPAAEPAKGDK